LPDVILGTFCGSEPASVDTYANVATLIFKSDNNPQPNYNGFIVRVNASVEGSIVYTMLLLF
jgi:hypothetical protein